MLRLQETLVMLLIAAMTLLSGCAGSTETAPPEAAASETTQTATESPSSESEQDEEALSEARERYQELVNGVEQAYTPFYELYDYGSQDVPAMKRAAGVVADGMRTFTAGLKSYNWPDPVKQPTVNAVVASYAVDAKAWDEVASVSTIKEMEEKLISMDASVAEANALTNDLRTQLGLTTR